MIKSQCAEWFVDALSRVIIVGIVNALLYSSIYYCVALVGNNIMYSPKTDQISRVGATTLNLKFQPFQETHT